MWGNVVQHRHNLAIDVAYITSTKYMPNFVCVLKGGFLKKKQTKSFLKHAGISTAFDGIKKSPAISASCANKGFKTVTNLS